MKEILESLYARQTLSEEEAFHTMRAITAGEHADAMVASFLTVYRMRSVTVDELCGFRRALLDVCVKPLESGEGYIDVCGTGGDGKNTFNISTISAFVVAGAGQKVAKHGNYGVSSGCGSSNVLEALGAKLPTEKEVVQRSLHEAGICYFHAPLFHPAMKNVGPVRKALGVKTVFNILGPLANPVAPSSQLAGVYSYDLVRLYSYVFQRTGQRYSVVHSLDGYDEISLTGAVHIASSQGEYTLEPHDLGFDPVQPEELHGGSTIQESAQIFRDVLSGRGSKAQQSVVEATAALALLTADGAETISAESFEPYRKRAQEAIASGAALNALESFLNICR
jgi:anthranilate phosphoribosyltransferase